jgi:hypothetical protein
MTKEQRKQHVIDVHHNAINALIEDETTGIDMFIMRVDALDELLNGAMAMIDLMFWFDAEDKNDYF